MRSTTFIMLLATLATATISYAAPSPATGNLHSFVERDGVKFNIFKHAATGAQLEYVNNSGICETTPGVNQYSGYLSVGTNMNMWFWFFEARKDPENAPISAWLNGGPGCSSMIGLFQENGPCRFVDGSLEPSLNPDSFNEFANMLYIDQPIGTGFSYGTNLVTGTTQSAELVWKFLQAFFAQFPQYKSRDFGVFTESYGGKYGPGISDEIIRQNNAIKNGTVKGEEINLVALGVNNGWFEPYIAYKAHIDFSFNNTHKRVIDEGQHTRYMNALNGRCKQLIDSCAVSEGRNGCAQAQQLCGAQIESPISYANDFNVYDIRAPRDDPNPPPTYTGYLQRPDVIKKIGAQSEYVDCSNPANFAFMGQGDQAKSILPALSRVVNSGVQTLIWSGDADWICNWYGNLDAANSIDYPGKAEFAAKELEPYMFNGKEVGTVKTVGNLSFLRLYDAGHEAMYYQPGPSLQIFKQTMQKKAPFST
ncbi:putative carboxypeptidase S1 [Aulographum hederae CBS 113979]|uniref:Carboxypeptidase n=1 Tax=Aulographum hederae CBS 113979 TaxID=1176131 RepID=A0A6G1H9P3_9PEZI|nr:putative carboxypeptidase S1 [Aulographum hederae CBS 113979]